MVIIKRLIRNKKLVNEDDTILQFETFRIVNSVMADFSPDVC